MAKALYKNDTIKYNQFVKRHLGFFNGHPYFTSFALGSVTKLEEELVNGQGNIEQIEKLKNALIGPLGALGDQLFWAIVKPATFTFGVLFFFVVENSTVRLIFLLLLGILYNTPHLYVRIKGLLKGYQDGFLVCRFLKIDNFKKIKNIYSVIGIVSLGLVTSWIIVNKIGFDPIGIFVFAISILVAVVCKSIKSRTYYAMLVPVIIAVIIGVIKYQI